MQRLTINRAMDEALEKAAAQFGTPCYVYFEDEVTQRLEQVRATFGRRFHVSYAVKANPSPKLLQHMQTVADSLDVSSGGELQRGLDAGFVASDISFTGPAKSEAELGLAVETDTGHVVLESIEEAVLLNQLCKTHDKTQAVLIRVGLHKVPAGYGVRMAGRPTPFGIDEERLHDAIATIQELDRLKLAGFHTYSGTQCLEADSVLENMRNAATAFAEACAHFDIRAQHLVFGLGMGVPLHDGDEPLDLNSVEAGLPKVLEIIDGCTQTSNAQLVIEVGRFLVAEAGKFVTRVVRTKDSRGQHIALCDGGMNQHLAACGHLGAVIPRNYPISKVGAPSGDTKSYELVGPLCTSIDTLGRQVMLPQLVKGDLLAVNASGAYGLTASPVHFISHPSAKEIWVSPDGTLEDVSVL
jgi:diaminopimelate decarboxylase